MIKRTIEVKKNLEADIIPYLVQSACHYESSLYIVDSDKKINMKSIMGMTILKLNQGNQFVLEAEGADAEKAIEDLAACFEM